MRESKFNSWLVQVIIIACITISLVYNNSLALILAAIIAIVYTCFANYSSCLLLLLSITIFENSFKLSGILVWIFLLIILILRQLITKNKIYASILSTVMLIVLISIEIVDDVWNVGINGQTLSGIILVLFSFMLFTGQFNIRINSEEIVICFGTAFVFAMVYLLIQYGGLSSFINMFSSLSNGLTDSYRFGIKYGGTVGGAMAIPIYALLILAFSADCLTQLEVGKVSKAVVIVFDIIAVVFGALTVSRSFFLGLIILVVLCLISKTEGKSYAVRKVAAIIIVAAVVCFFAIRYQDIILQVIDNLFDRVATDRTGGTGGRTEIWMECLTYLENHPLALLFGKGTNGYPIVGRLLNKEFAAGSHNLYIDILMSWGIVGAVCVLTIVGEFVRPSEILYALKYKTICVVPFVILAVFAMTALRSNSVKTHVYFFITLQIIRQNMNAVVVEHIGGENDS